MLNNSKEEGRRNSHGSNPRIKVTGNLETKTKELRNQKKQKPGNQGKQPVNTVLI